MAATFPSASVFSSSQITLLARIRVVAKAPDDVRVAMVSAMMPMAPPRRSGVTPAEAVVAAVPADKHILPAEPGSACTEDGMADRNVVHDLAAALSRSIVSRLVDNIGGGVNVGLGIGDKHHAPNISTAALRRPAAASIQVVSAFVRLSLFRSATADFSGSMPYPVSRSLNQTRRRRSSAAQVLRWVENRLFLGDFPGPPGGCPVARPCRAKRGWRHSHEPDLPVLNGLVRHVRPGDASASMTGPRKAAR